MDFFPWVFEKMSSVGSKHNLGIGRLNNFCLDKIVATLTRPSVPEWIFWTLPRHNCPGAHLSSLMRTRSLSLTMRCSLNHFGRDCKRFKYSEYHFFQNDSFILSMAFHHCKCRGFVSRKLSSCIQTVGSPMRKWIRHYILSDIWPI